MTPRELSGWVPAERHEHFDAEGNLTGYTVVIRESRIDDADRASLLGLAMFEDQVCRCGFHPSIADDDDNTFTPEARKCPVCAGEAQWSRMLSDEDEKASKAAPHAPPGAPRPSDGRYPYMRFLSPAEAEKVKQTRPSRG